MNFFDVGRIIKNAEVKQVKETNLITFTIAIDRKMQKDKSSFINIKMFRKTDNISQYLLKGTLIKVVGELQVDNVKDSEGNYKTYVSVVADDIKLLGGKKQNEPATNDIFEDMTPVDGGDMPF